MSVDQASALIGWLWRIFARHNARHGRALDNLALAFPDMDEAERQRIALGMWDNLGRVFAESFLLDQIGREPDRVDLSGAEAVARLAGSGRGAVLVSLHLGDWELASQAAMRLGLAPAGVYQELRNPLVEAHVRAMRLPWYSGGLYKKKRGEDNTALKILRHVRAGGAVAILGDLRDGRGVGVPLIAAAIIRTKGVHFTAKAVEIPIPRTTHRDADVLAATAEVHRVFETWIRANPEQWFWIHRKWARPGERATD
jgi:KDO2-lipid IV(A) lauroyltransferase